MRREKKHAPDPNLPISQDDTPGRLLSNGKRKVNLSQVFAGQKIGIREVSEKIWLVSFVHYDLGFFDEEADRVECAENPFGAKVSTMSSV
jgi:putative transposase